VKPGGASFQHSWKQDKCEAVNKEMNRQSG
jgi:hypothetical protein